MIIGIILRYFENKILHQPVLGVVRGAVAIVADFILS